MRILIRLLLLLLLTAIIVQPQEKDKWERVYTLEDATIAMNTTRVEFSGGEIAAVQFRWNYSKPQSLDNSSDLKYRTRVETVEFNCARRRYRTAGYTLLDNKGKAILSIKPEQPEEWKFVKGGSMMERLLGPACKLIDEKRP
jgi:hypothetical protein